MSDRTPLSSEQIQDTLADLPGWTFEANALTKTYTFSSFREAVSFIVRVAFSAEELNHHPELSGGRAPVLYESKFSVKITAEKDTNGKIRAIRRVKKNDFLIVTLPVAIPQITYFVVFFVLYH